MEASASFADERTLQGGDISVQAPIIVLNTGKSPAIPPIPGLDDVNYLTYRTFWELESLPERTLVLGGGYVGSELGQGLARLGSTVHIVDRDSRPVSQGEEDVSDAILEALRRDGIRFSLETEVTDVRQEDDAISVELDNGQRVEVDALLITTGRKPNTAALNPLVHVFMAHMEAGSTWQVLERSVHVHPTYAEGLPVLARNFKTEKGDT